MHHAIYDGSGRRPACHFGIIDRAASSANQRGAVMGPEPFRDTILVLDEFLDRTRRSHRSGVCWSINPLASGQAVP